MLILWLDFSKTLKYTVKINDKKTTKHLFIFTHNIHTTHNVHITNNSNKAMQLTTASDITEWPRPLLTGSAPVYLEQCLLLALPGPQVLLQGDSHPLGVTPATPAHAQLSQLLAHWAVQRAEVLRDGSFPAGGAAAGAATNTTATPRLFTTRPCLLYLGEAGEEG